MIHARNDYNDRIQDTKPVKDGGVPENEPVFLLRGQDEVAADVVRIWVTLHLSNGGDKDIAEMAIKWANKMDEWKYKKSADL